MKRNLIILAVVVVAWIAYRRWSANSVGSPAPAPTPALPNAIAGQAAENASDAPEPAAPADPLINGIPQSRLNADSADDWQTRLIELGKKGKILQEGSKQYNRQSKKFGKQWFKEHASDYAASPT